MAIEEAAERAVFFDADEFGVSVSWVVGVTPFAVAAIFTADPLEVASFDGLGISSRSPVFVCATETVPAGGARKDVVTINSADYRITDIRPSGDGVTRVSLEEV